MIFHGYVKLPEDNPTVRGDWQSSASLLKWWDSQANGWLIPGSLGDTGLVRCLQNHRTVIQFIKSSHVSLADSLSSRAVVGRLGPTHILLDRHLEPGYWRVGWLNGMGWRSKKWYPQLQAGDPWGRFGKFPKQWASGFRAIWFHMILEYQR